MPYYIVENGQRVGPLSDSEFEHRVLSGNVTDQTYVWQPGMANWVRYGELNLSRPAPAPAPQAFDEATTSSTVAASGVAMGTCSECFRSFPVTDMVTLSGATVCGSCKPILVQRVREGGNSPTILQYAGFWWRFLAKILDSILQQCIFLPLGYLLVGNAAIGISPDPNTAPPSWLFGLYMLISMLIPLTYTTFFLGKFGATPGKMAVGIAVVRPDGERITYLRAFGRHFAEILSGMICSIGYIMAAFDAEKRALHDHICDTRVIIKNR